jgi:hypothetical protein
MKRVVGLLVIVLLAPLSGAWAQIATGNIYGKVVDESGAIMPGATVSLTGPTIGRVSTVTNAGGEFHFLNLDPSRYTVEVALVGFATVVRDAIINTGQNVELSFSLKVASQAETVTVTADTPTVDTKRVGTATTLTKEELSGVPNSRDPWALLRTIPGVVVDRVNVAGNESGQQSQFQGKGAMVNDAVWTLDGVTITDMSAAGSSSTYFDYDAFDEVNFSTGGNDIKMATGGIGLNFVTKRGTNGFHGNVHGYLTNHVLQSSNLAGSGISPTDPRLALPDGSFSDNATHIDQVADYGGDLGGPIIKDKLWFWGSYGRQDIRNVNFNQTTDRTVLVNYSGKLNWQASPSDMVSFFYFQGVKDKYGRNIGPVPNNAQSFLDNQSGAYGNGPPGLFKGEWDHVFGPSLTIAAKYAYYNTGFGFTPIGGMGQQGGYNLATQTSVGSYESFSSIRTQQVATVDGNYFFTGMGGSNELKFGFSYRRTPVTSTTTYAGDGILAQGTGVNALGQETGNALISRPLNKTILSQYTNGYLGDTFTRGRVTLNAGVRYDHQTGANEASSAPANPAYPTLLPALNYPGGGPTITWNNVSPRLAMSVALDDSRKTVARVSYARYAGQLANGDVGWANPLGSLSILAYNWTDLNHDGVVEPNEINFAQGLVYAGFVNPANPGTAVSPNQIASSYSANIDNEVIVGLDREIIPSLAVNLAYTWRKSTNTIEWFQRLGVTPSDYSVATPAQTVNGYTSAPAYGPSASSVAATGGGGILENRPDYTSSYNGVELSLVKRLSNKWMARVAMAYMDWVENYSGPAAIGNPTLSESPGTEIGGGQPYFSGPQVDGGVFPLRSAGSGKGDIFFEPKWQVSANALYQLGWGTDVSGSFFARQGYPQPIMAAVSAGLDGTVYSLAVPTIDTVRYPDLYDLDLRLSKSFKFGNGGNASVIVDCFNVFNSNTTLNVTRNILSPHFNTMGTPTSQGNINEIINPRIFRIGLRIGF